MHAHVCSRKYMLSFVAQGITCIYWNIKTIRFSLSNRDKKINEKKTKALYRVWIDTCTCMHWIAKFFNSLAFSPYIHVCIIVNWNISICVYLF